MSQKDLHDLVVQLREKRSGTDIVDSEYNQRLDEIIESLEQQQLYPDTFDQYSSLIEQVKALVQDFENEHQGFKAVLDSIQLLLNNFRT